MNTLVTSEILLSFPFIEYEIGDHQGRIIGVRIVIWVITVCVSLFFNDISKEVTFCGSLFTPFLGYFCPLIMYYCYALNRRNKISDWRIIHDIVFFVISAGICYLGLRNSIGELGNNHSS